MSGIATVIGEIAGSAVGAASPLNAALKTLDSFNTLLNSPEGQKLMADERAFIMWVLKGLHIHIDPTTPMPATTTIPAPAAPASQ